MKKYILLLSLVLAGQLMASNIPLQVDSVSGAVANPLFFSSTYNQANFRSAVGYSGTSSIPAFNSSGTPIYLTGTSAVRIVGFNASAVPTTITTTGVGSVMLNNGPAATNMLITGTNEFDGTVIGSRVEAGLVNVTGTFQISGTSLGTLAYQSGLFSGTTSGLHTGTSSGLQSGTNSGDNKPSSTVLITGGTLSVSGSVSTYAGSGTFSGTNNFASIYEENIKIIDVLSQRLLFAGSPESDGATAIDWATNGQIFVGAPLYDTSLSGNYLNLPDGSIVLSGTAYFGGLVISGTDVGTAIFANTGTDLTQIPLNSNVATAPVASGSNTVSLQSALNVKGFKGSVTTPAITDQPGVDNYNQTGLDTASVLRFNNALPSSIVDISGIVGGSDGRILTVINVSSGTDEFIYLRHEAAESSAANRITSATGTDYLLGKGQIIDLIYDSTTQRWRMRDLDYRSVNVVPATVENSNTLYDAPNDIRVIIAENGENQVEFANKEPLFDNPGAYRTALGLDGPLNVSGSKVSAVYSGTGTLAASSLGALATLNVDFLIAGITTSGKYAWSLGASTSVPTGVVPMGEPFVVGTGTLRAQFINVALTGVTGTATIWTVGNQLP